MTKLYHGTSAKHLTAILTDGIKPREELQADGKVTHRPGNWQEYPSIPDMVYLTTCYPLFFANTATEEAGEDLVVFEIDLDDLDHDNLFPDEDVISQSLLHEEQKEDPDITLEDVHNGVVETGIDSWQHLWERAMEVLGNVGHRGTIPPEKIKRYCVIHMDKMKGRWNLISSMMDPMIMPMNFQIKGWFYTQFVQWCFGDVDVLPHYTECENVLGSIDPKLLEKMKADNPELDEQIKAMGNHAELAEHRVKAAKHWAEESENREGFEVVTL